MEKLVDLHQHCNFSDGDYDLKTLIQLLDNAKVEIFSITDHDSIKSAQEVLNNKEISEMIRNFKMKYVTGVELSCIHNDYTCHILAYGYDVNSPYIKAVVKKTSELRKQKMYYLLEELKKRYGIVLPKEDVEEMLKKEIVGKPDVAHIMLKNGLGPDVRTCYRQYLKQIKTPEFKIGAEEAIKAVHKAGGIAVLAHPKEVKDEFNLSYEQIESFIEDLKDIALDGLETFHSSHTKEDVDFYREVAKKNNLAESAGSDYHGEKTKPFVTMAVVAEDTKMPTEKFEKMNNVYKLAKLKQKDDCFVGKIDM